MNLDDIKQILELVREHELAEFELERDGLKLRIRKQPDAVAPGVSLTHGNMHPTAPLAPAGPPASAPVAPEDAGAPADEEGEALAVVKSPIVGTFYRTAEPGARPFVEVGDRVRKGQVLCIIEAMKLMNEIDSEDDGDVISIYVENGQPVQYGERLFAIRVTK